MHTHGSVCAGGGMCPVAMLGGCRRVLFFCARDLVCTCRHAQAYCTRVCTSIGTCLCTQLWAAETGAEVVSSLICIGGSESQRCVGRAGAGEGPGQRAEEEPCKSPW